MIAVTPATILFRDTAGQHASRICELLAPYATCGEAVDRMRQRSDSCCLVVDSDQRLIGIITANDVARRIAFSAEPDSPVSSFMTQPVCSINRNEPLYRAVALVGRREMRRLPVVNDAGQPVGLLTRSHLMSLANEVEIDLCTRFAHDRSAEELRLVRQQQPRLARVLLQRAVRAPEVLRVLSDLNDQVHRRALEQILDEMTVQGWGDPPVPFAVIVMGSGGRRESLLCPDQDNGFILGEYPDEHHVRVSEYFYELARRMTARLDEAGLPPCKGYVMATNPTWRKRLSEWETQFLGWLRRPSTASTTLTDVSVDFRCVFGDRSLADALRRYLAEKLSRHHGFLRELESLQFDHDVAITPLGTLKLEKKPGEEAHRKIDVKRKGIMPLVEGVRILALRSGIEATPTLARLSALTEMGALHKRLAKDVAYAFEFLTGLLLEQQIAQALARRRPSAYVSPQVLSPAEKLGLKRSLATAARLRSTVHSEMTAEIF